MSFFTASNSELNILTNAAALVEGEPRLADRFDAIAELRSMDDGSLYKGQPFKRVASIIAPFIDIAHILEPEFMKNKRKFYAWLDDNKEYCTYDRRRTARPIEGQVTYFDGKPI